MVIQQREPGIVRVFSQDVHQQPEFALLQRDLHTFDLHSQPGVVGDFAERDEQLAGNHHDVGGGGPGPIWCFPFVE